MTIALPQKTLSQNSERADTVKNLFFDTLMYISERLTEYIYEETDCKFEIIHRVK